jgi:hypothetical protein
MDTVNVLGLVVLATVAFVGTCLLLRDYLSRVVHMLVGKVIVVAAEETPACLPPAPAKGVYVSPHVSETDKTSKWAVKDELGVLLSTHKTQAEAEKAGRALALANLSELVVVGKNGVVRKRNSYGT